MKYIFYYILLSCTRFPMLLACESPHQDEHSHYENLLAFGNASPIWRLFETPLWCQILSFIAVVSLFEKQLISNWKRVNKIKTIASINSVLFITVKTIVGIFLLVLFLPLFIPVYIILLFIKKFFMIIFYYLFEDSITELSGFDIMFAVSCENPIISALATFEGAPNEKDYFRRIEEIIYSFLPDGTQPFRRFRQLLHRYYGYYIWKDAEGFDLNNHIKTVDLHTLYGSENEYTTKKSDDSSCAEALVCKYLNDNGAKYFPANVPKWEVVFLTYGNKSKFTILFRLHHSIGDGVALTRLLLETLADKPTKVSLLGPPSSPLVKFLVTLWSVAFIPFGLLLFALTGRKNPLHGPPLTGNSIYVTSREVPFESVKSIKRTTKTSSIAILCSCLSSSLASFFERRGHEVSDVGIIFPIGFENLSAPVRMTNTFFTGMLAMPTPSNRELLKSQEISEQGLKFPCIKRLMNIEKKFHNAQQDPTILSLSWMAKILVPVLPSFLCRIFAQTNGKTMVVSNVPGPAHDVYILNRKVKTIWFWIPNIPPTGIGFGFMTYKGYLRVSYNVDRALIKDEEEAERIADDFLKALEGLQSEVAMLSLKNNSL